MHTPLIRPPGGWPTGDANTSKKQFLGPLCRGGGGGGGEGKDLIRGHAGIMCVLDLGSRWDKCVFNKY